MTALLLVSGDPNNHNLPQSGRLFILRVMAMQRQSAPREPLRYTVIPFGKTVKRRREETVIHAECGVSALVHATPARRPLVLLAEALTGQLR